MSMQGMHVDSIVSMADQLRQQAESLEQSVRKVDSLVGLAAQHWQGPDLAQFRSAWDQDFKRTSANLSQHLRELSDTARRNAEEQRRTSATLDGVGGGSAPSGVPGLPQGGPTGGGGGEDRPFTDNALYRDASYLLKALTSPTKLGTVLPWLDRIGVLATGGVSDLGLLGKAGFLAKGATEFDDLAKALSVPSNWANIGAEASKVLKASELGLISEYGAGIAGKIGPLLQEGGSLASVMGTAGKVLGPVGAAFSLANTVSDFQQGNTGRGVYDSVMTVASVAACIPVPPINAIGAGVAGGMALAQLAYDHIPFVHSTVDTVVNKAGEFLSSINPFHW